MKWKPVPVDLSATWNEVVGRQPEMPKIILLDNGLAPARAGSPIYVPKPKAEPPSIWDSLKLPPIEALDVTPYFQVFMNQTFCAEAEKPPEPTVDTVRLESLKASEPRRIPPPPPRVPDSVQPIVAWRSWGINRDDGCLTSLASSTAWEAKKKMVAECDKEEHEAPQMDCQCGVWAFKDLDRLIAAVQYNYTPAVLGTVYLWGRVIECENGFRAQFAYPKELWLLEDSLESLGWIYNVPIRSVANPGGSG